MSSTVLSLTLPRVASRGSAHFKAHSVAGFLQQLPKCLGGHLTFQVATLKATHGEKYPYAEPYPYWKKSFIPWGALLDKTAPRFNENTKIIVVDGNVAVGKKEFARRLANEFDLKYFGPTEDTACFTNNNPYGYDMRKIDNCLPEKSKCYDLKKFYADKHPEKGTVGRLQLVWYEMKFYDYARALKHLLNTGQGVVLVRSAYSDQVFVEAMRKMGYVTAPFVKYYNEYRDNTLCDLLKPHLTIYLDAPLSVVRERIKQRNDPREVNSAVLSDAYLQAIADAYRQKFLPKMRQSGEVVEVDWTEKASDMDMDVIAEELQLLSLESETSDDKKFEDWNRKTEDDWIFIRQFLDSQTFQVATFNMPQPWDCPEVMVYPEDVLELNKVLERHPVWTSKKGWAPELGHKTLFKFGS